MRLLILIALILVPSISYGDIVRIDVRGRVVRSWDGGVWPLDNKHYAAGSFEYYIPGETIVQGRVVRAGEVSAGAVSGIKLPDGANDGLDQLNAQRRQRGLRPYQRDDALTLGAARAAAARASRLNDGHTPNDFQYLPRGSSARAAGCAAWPASMGWGSCCAYDTQYSTAGAAWCYGRDGKRYMHLFVR